LKSFELTKGEKIAFLKSRRVGHDLIIALSIAKNHSLSDFVDTSNNEEAEIAKANQYYNDKGFEYFKIQNLFDKSNLPDLQVLKNYSEKLLKNTKGFKLSSA
jgi:hypothetical protein